MSAPSDSTSADPPESAQPSRRNLLLAMAGVAATVVLVAFDATIVATTLPRVAQALNGIALYAWVGTGYLLANAASILVFGRLGDLFGRKTLMLTSVSIVAIGSLLCGLSQSMGQLIAFRILQGIGGGMMIATAFAAPADLFPDARERVRWMAMVSVSFAVASGVGPLAGGAITEHFGWRAAFFVSPIAAVAAFILLARYFPALRPLHKIDQRIDWIGAALLVVAVSAPLAALELGFASGSHASPGLAVLLAAAGATAIALLVPHERHHASPIFPLRILKTPQSQRLNLLSIAVGATMFTLIFYTPLILQTELHYPPSQAGLLMTPMVAGIPVGSIINGWLFPRQSEPQRLMVFGAGLLTAGCILALTFVSDTPPWRILTSFLLCGVGLGFLLPNLTLFMQMLAERRDLGVASALVQTTRAVGSAVGTALVGIAISYTSVRTGVRIGLGAAWFSSIGRPNNVGTKLFMLSGHVNTPCTVEESLGITFRELVEKHAGGIRGGWDNLLAVIPGGASCPVVRGEEMIDVIMDFDGLRAVKSSFGTGGAIVMDKSTDIIKAIWRISAFFKHESCGQCTPCREGTGWMMRLLGRMVEGRAQRREIDLLFDVSKQVEGHTICALGDAAAWPIQGLIRNFRSEIEKRIDAYTYNAVQSHHIVLEAAE